MRPHAVWTMPTLPMFVWQDRDAWEAPVLVVPALIVGVRAALCRCHHWTRWIGINKRLVAYLLAGYIRASFVGACWISSHAVFLEPAKSEQEMVNGKKWKEEEYKSR